MEFRFILDIGYNQNITHVIIDLLALLNTQVHPNFKLKVDYKHKYTTEFKEKLNLFTERYKSDSPSIHRLKNFFNPLAIDDWFFILPAIDFKTKDRILFEKELDELNGIKHTDEQKAMEKLFECVTDNYEIVSFNLDRSNKIKIGKGVKKERVCRFCDKKMPEVTFNNEAHAISEALGNKKLILNEECDSCNRFFDENIERDFINYHDLARTILGVKNKENKSPKMKGQNFNMFKGAHDLSIAIIDPIDRDDKSRPPEKLVLKTNHKIRFQNIYKTLCKFALSVLDRKYIVHFSETKKWIKNELTLVQLPKISVLISPFPKAGPPEIILYQRNSDNMKVPYLVGEFRFTYYIYVFIIPLSDKDNSHFLKAEEFEEYLECFQHMKSTEAVNYIDFSQNIERKINFNINLEQIKD